MNWVHNLGDESEHLFGIESVILNLSQFYYVQSDIFPQRVISISNEIAQLFRT